MNVQELATKAITGDPMAQVMWSALSTRDILQMLRLEVEEKMANKDIEV
jgi:hypothetical protein